MTCIKSLFKKIAGTQQAGKNNPFRLQSATLYTDWLLDNYIPQGGMTCLRTGTHDKAYHWANQLATDLFTISDSFCDKPLHKEGNALVLNNSFLPSTVEPFMEHDTYRMVHLNTSGSSLYRDFEALAGQVDAVKPVLLIVTDLPLWLTGKGYENESSLSDGLCRLRRLAIESDISILGICPDHQAPLLATAAAYVESISDTAIRLDPIREYPYVYEMSLLKTQPFSSMPAPAYYRLDGAYQVFKRLDEVFDSLSFNRKKRTPYQLEERKFLAGKLRENGVECPKIARMFGVNISTIYKWTNENSKEATGFPFPDISGRSILHFKGKVIFDGKFH